MAASASRKMRKLNGLVDRRGRKGKLAKSREAEKGGKESRVCGERGHGLLGPSSRLEGVELREWGCVCGTGSWPEARRVGPPPDVGHGFRLYPEDSRGADD